MRRRIGAVVAVCLLPLCGCFSYTAIDAPPVPGADVRAQLNPAGTAWLFETLGRQRSEIGGTFVRSEPDSYVLATWRTDVPTSRRVRSSIDTLRVPRGYIRVMEKRELSIGRTALAALAATGVVYVIAREVSGAGGSGPGDDDGTRFILSLRLPFAP